jgi:hypothetical protein
MLNVSAHRDECADHLADRILPADERRYEDRTLLVQLQHRIRVSTLERVRPKPVGLFRRGRRHTHLRVLADRGAIIGGRSLDRPPMSLAHAAEEDERYCRCEAEAEAIASASAVVRSTKR